MKRVGKFTSRPHLTPRRRARRPRSNPDCSAPHRVSSNFNCLDSVAALGAGADLERRLGENVLRRRPRALCIQGVESGGSPLETGTKHRKARCAGVSRVLYFLCLTSADVVRGSWYVPADHALVRIPSQLDITQTGHGSFFMAAVVSGLRLRFLRHHSPSVVASTTDHCARPARPAPRSALALCAPGACAPPRRPRHHQHGIRRVRRCVRAGCGRLGIGSGTCAGAARDDSARPQTQQHRDNARLF
jgi:hypothetical protein